MPIAQFRASSASRWFYVDPVWLTRSFAALEPDSIQLAKTASRSTRGFMDQMGFELRHFIAYEGGLARCDIDALNHQLRRTLRKRGDHVQPIAPAS